MLWLGENNEGWWGKRNKSTTPSLTFPFAININKAGNLVEKADVHEGGSGIKITC